MTWYGAEVGSYVLWWKWIEDNKNIQRLHRWDLIGLSGVVFKKVIENWDHLYRRPDYRNFSGFFFFYWCSGYWWWPYFVDWDFPEKKFGDFVMSVAGDERGPYSRAARWRMVDSLCFKYWLCCRKSWYHIMLNVCHKTGICNSEPKNNF